MKPEEALKRSAAFLDEATENLTFDAFLWSLEEAWRGVAWALHALGAPPPRLGPPGLPPAGGLEALLRATPKAPREAEVARRLEALRRALPVAPEAQEAAAAALSPGIVQAVFDAWALHDVCGVRLGLLDDRLDQTWAVEKAAPGRLGSRLVNRRSALKALLVGSVAPLAACRRAEPARADEGSADKAPGAKAQAPVPALAQARPYAVEPLGGMHWKTSDPFLFCAHHNDQYPQGNAQMGPQASLEGRQLGRDFVGKDNWRMYHGQTVPGFPRHPHRGFETVTVVRTGLLDHSDSLGATARYGQGDVQWLTAGRGIQHAEMFPLLRQDQDNPLELFQIWLNLPASDKMAPPHFTMLWDQKIPRITQRDAQGRATVVTAAAGAFGGQAPPSPPPHSWASRASSEVAIWSVKMEAGASFTLPAVSAGVHRSLYLHQGDGIHLEDRAVPGQHRIEVRDPGPLTLQATAGPVELLLLQGRPIGEPVAKRGPFVMNTQQEIQQAYTDYRRTSFGGWPWEGNDPVHERQKGRFAIHIDGHLDEPT